MSDGPARSHDDVRTFFGPRAADWNQRFAEDAPAFTRAVADLAITPGGTALDVGCGAGRAIPDLAAAVGPAGRVIGVDLTFEMLAAARRQVPSATRLALADTLHLPLRDDRVDAFFTAGLLHHLTDPARGLAELARVARTGARLAVFHPIGRTALATKHGHPVRPDDLLDPETLPPLLATNGWEIVSIDDGPDRYLALATRVT